METISQLKNNLLKRNEVEIAITQDITPSIKESIKTISEKFKAKEDTIKIKEIKGKFGSHDFVIKANIYDNAEAKNKIEVKTKKEKEAEAKAAEEAAKEAEKAKEETTASEETAEPKTE